MNDRKKSKYIPSLEAHAQLRGKEQHPDLVSTHNNYLSQYTYGPLEKTVYTKKFEAIIKQMLHAPSSLSFKTDNQRFYVSGKIKLTRIEASSQVPLGSYVEVEEEIELHDEDLQALIKEVNFNHLYFTPEEVEAYAELPKTTEKFIENLSWSDWDPGELEFAQQTKNEYALRMIRKTILDRVLSDRLDTGENQNQRIPVGELLAIRYYTYHGDVLMNAMLRGLPVSPDNSENIHTLVSAAILSHALNRLPDVTIPYIFRLERAYDLETKIALAKRDAVTRTIGFTSTSLKVGAYSLPIKCELKLMSSLTNDDMTQATKGVIYLSETPRQFYIKGMAQKDMIPPEVDLTNLDNKLNDPQLKKDILNVLQELGHQRDELEDSTFVSIVYRNVRGKDISRFSIIPKEREYLIPPSTDVRYTDYQLKDNLYQFIAEGASRIDEEEVYWLDTLLKANSQDRKLKFDELKLQSVIDDNALLRALRKSPDIVAPIIPSITSSLTGEEGQRVIQLANCYEQMPAVFEALTSIGATLFLDDNLMTIPQLMALHQQDKNKFAALVCWNVAAACSVGFNLNELSTLYDDNPVKFKALTDNHVILYSQLSNKTFSELSEMYDSNPQRFNAIFQNDEALEVLFNHQQKLDDLFILYDTCQSTGEMFDGYMIGFKLCAEELTHVFTEQERTDLQQAGIDSFALIKVAEKYSSFRIKDLFKKNPQKSTFLTLLKNKELTLDELFEFKNDYPKFRFLTEEAVHLYPKGATFQEVAMTYDQYKTKPKILNYCIREATYFEDAYKAGATFRDVFDIYRHDIRKFEFLNDYNRYRYDGCPVKVLYQSGATFTEVSRLYDENKAKLDVLMNDDVSRLYKAGATFTEVSTCYDENKAKFDVLIGHGACRLYAGGATFAEVSTLYDENKTKFDALTQPHIGSLYFAYRGCFQQISKLYDTDRTKFEALAAVNFRPQVWNQAAFQYLIALDVKTIRVLASPAAYQEYANGITFHDYILRRALTVGSASLESKAPIGEPSAQTSTMSGALRQVDVSHSHRDPVAQSPDSSKLMSTPLPKLSDHGTVRFEVGINGQPPVSIASRNLQNPFGFRFPAPWDRNADPQYSKYYPPKWDGPDLPEDINLAATALVKYKYGLEYDSTRHKAEEEPLKNILRLLRQQPTSIEEKAKQVDELRRSIAIPFLGNYYPFEQDKLYKARIATFLEKMKNEGRSILMLQEIPQFTPWSTMFEAAVRESGLYDSTTMILPANHTSGIIGAQRVRLGNQQTRNRGELVSSLRELPGMRFQFAETDNAVYVVVHTTAEILCNKDAATGQYSFDQGKLDGFIAQLNNIRSKIDKPLILAGDFNVPVEFADRISQGIGGLGSPKIQAQFKHSRQTVNNNFVTLDGAIVIAPDSCAVTLQEGQSQKKIARRAGNNPGPSKHRVALGLLLETTPPQPPITTTSPALPLQESFVFN